MSNIVFVGPMGAGKSTIGKGLARLMRRGFVDTDAEIRRRTGVEIATIFEIEGEAGFRDRETQVLAEELETREQTVIATGGGIVMRAENRDLLRRAFVVYLRIPVDEQYRRTRNSEQRPLLKTDDPKARLAELFRVRDPLYRDVASVVLEGRHRRIQDAVHAVHRMLPRELRAQPCAAEPAAGR